MYTLRQNLSGSPWKTVSSRWAWALVLHVDWSEERDHFFNKEQFWQKLKIFLQIFFSLWCFLWMSLESYTIYYGTTLPYHAILCCGTISSYAIRHYTVVCYIILYCSKFICGILHYAIHYTTVYYTIPDNALVYYTIPIYTTVCGTLQYTM